MTVAFSQDSCAMRCARSSPSQLRATDEARQRLGQLDHQRVMRRGRQVGPRQQRFTDRREMAEALRRSGRARTPRCRRRGFRSASGTPRPMPTSAIAAATERGSARAARSRTASQHRRRAIASTRSESSSSGERSSTIAAMSGWSSTSACTTAAGASRARAERFGERAAHQRRRIVEQHDHRAFGGDAVVLRQIGIEVGAGER